MEKVVIVNGTSEALDMVQPVLTAGRYDVVFVESNLHAYSHIKRERPSLVILCLNMQEREGFQVLSMLKLDDETRSIPLLTCFGEYEAAGAAAPDIEADEDAEEMLAHAPVSMN